MFCAGLQVLNVARSFIHHHAHADYVPHGARTHPAGVHRSLVGLSSFILPMVRTARTSQTLEP